MHVNACALAFAKVYAKKGIATLLWFAKREGTLNQNLSYIY